MAKVSPFIETALKRFGLTPKDVTVVQQLDTKAGPCVIAGGADGVMSPAIPVTRIATTRLSELKRWIGNDDALFESGRIDRMTVSAALKDKIGTDTDELSLVEQARHYIYSDSNDFASAVPLIEDRLGPFNITMAVFETIVVDPAHPLIIEGCEPVTIMADTLIFDGKGAHMDAYINLSMVVNKVQVHQ